MCGVLGSSCKGYVVVDEIGDDTRAELCPHASIPLAHEGMRISKKPSFAESQTGSLARIALPKSSHNVGNITRREMGTIRPIREIDASWSTEHVLLTPSISKCTSRRKKRLPQADGFYEISMTFE